MKRTMWTSSHLPFLFSFPCRKSQWNLDPELKTNDCTISQDWCVKINIAYRYLYGSILGLPQYLSKVCFIKLAIWNHVQYQNIYHYIKLIIFCNKLVTLIIWCNKLPTKNIDFRWGKSIEKSTLLNSIYRPSTN